MQLIDTHCHLDADEFSADRGHVASLAREQGVTTIVVPSVAVTNFDSVRHLSNQHSNCVYALGIHPLYVDQAQEALDLPRLESELQPTAVVAVGEIGLDYFVSTDNRARQQLIFQAQLSLAKQFSLPVILHSRRAVDDVLYQLRRAKLSGGIAHAFNGSLQQAQQFIALGFKLGFGGAMTWSRAHHLQRLAKQLPLDAIVLETDAPDMPPAWLAKGARNSPLQLHRIAEFLAQLRGIDCAEVARQTSLNARIALPRLI